MMSPAKEVKGRSSLTNGFLYNKIYIEKLTITFSTD